MIEKDIQQVHFSPLVLPQKLAKSSLFTENWH